MRGLSDAVLARLRLGGVMAAGLGMLLLSGFMLLHEASVTHLSCDRATGTCVLDRSSVIGASHLAFGATELRGAAPYASGSGRSRREDVALAVGASTVLLLDRGGHDFWPLGPVVARINAFASDRNAPRLDVWVGPGFFTVALGLVFAGTGSIALGVGVLALKGPSATLHPISRE